MFCYLYWYSVWDASWARESRALHVKVCASANSQLSLSILQNWPLSLFPKAMHNKYVFIFHLLKFKPIYPFIFINHSYHSCSHSFALSAHFSHHYEKCQGCFAMRDDNRASVERAILASSASSWAQGHPLVKDRGVDWCANPHYYTCRARQPDNHEMFSTFACARE